MTWAVRVPSRWIRTLAAGVLIDLGTSTGAGEGVRIPLPGVTPAHDAGRCS